MADELPKSPAQADHDALDDLAGRNPKGVPHPENRAAQIEKAVSGSSESSYKGGVEGGHTVDASGQPVAGAGTVEAADHSDAGDYDAEKSNADD